jgi:hypothetical protein
MPAITIEISEDKLQKLENLAALHGITTEVLLRSGIDDWLNSKPEFINAANYVIRKNSELYQRLA